MDGQQDKTEFGTVKKEEKSKCKYCIQGLSLLFASIALVISILSYNYSVNSFEIENRAYIYIQAVYPSNIYEPYFEFKFKNYGKTPAKEIKVSELRIFEEEVFTIIPPLIIDSTEIVMLIADAENSIRVHSNKTYYSIAEQLGKVFIVGKVVYKDIFDESHQTQFAGWLRAHGENQYLNFQGRLNLID